MNLLSLHTGSAKNLGCNTLVKAYVWSFQVAQCHVFSQLNLMLSCLSPEVGKETWFLLDTSVSEIKKETRSLIKMRLFIKERENGVNKTEK